ncbi:unnamed protein product [Brassicogethes aeneus]|uniref:Cytochrome P450 n=1 Tax=Brassicogethes aeneus TaxID=1431903 RepID=A0A9P0B656_BRAAE|nr:unnamed protein product [Brassicogethes aeneus]
MAFLVSGSFLVDAVGVVVALLAILYTSFKWSFGYWKRKNFPYMEPSIPFGNLENALLPKKVPLFENTQNWYNYGKERKLKHFGLFFATSPVYFVLDLGLIKNILVTDFEYWVDRGNMYNEKSDPLSAHLVNLGGSRWKNLRKKLTPTFTSGKLKLMFKTITDCSVFLEKAMDEKLKDKQSVDIKNMLGNFTTDVIGSCAFGLECNSFSGDSDFRRFGKKIFSNIKLRMIKINLMAAFPRIANFFNMKIMEQETTDFFINAVKDTMRYRKENNVSRKDFLQILIDNQAENSAGDGNSLTFMEIAAQAFVFFIAGYETSATTMTFALFEMSLNQDVQERVRQEVKEVLDRHNGEINYDSIMEMKYMEQVMKETLRMFSPATVFSRKCVQDYKVPGSDLVIEKGTLALIPVIGIHYDEDHFPNPAKFDPDRFSDENIHNIKPFSHLAFGGGRRECIGERFGIMQSKVGLATLLKKYKFTLSKKTQLPLKMDPSQFITTAVGDIWLDYEKI